MAPRSDIKPVASLIPFTRFPDQDRISLLLWRFHRHTPLQSARFYHDLVIPSPPFRDHEEYQDALDRRDQLLCDHVDHCFPGLFSDFRQRIRSSKAVLRIQVSGVELILLPVRPIQPVESSIGTGVWIEIDQIVDRSRSTTLDCNFGDDLDLYLPVMAALRDHYTAIVQHLVKLGLDADRYDLNANHLEADIDNQLPDAPVQIAFRDDFYSCAKCSRALFNNQDVEQHDRPHDNRVCASIFLKDSIRTFGNLVDVEGKLKCPHCGYRLGSYNWSGSQCSCGTWMAPAIQITSSRVDLMKKRIPRSVLSLGTTTLF